MKAAPAALASQARRGIRKNVMKSPPGGPSEAGIYPTVAGSLPGRLIVAVPSHAHPAWVLAALPRLDFG
jgi:hypothetical protein